MFTLTFNTDNEAFQDDAGYEINRIIQVVASAVMAGETEGKCLDANGNTVGDWVLE